MEKENMKQAEIENLVPSFVACLQPIIGRYRTWVGENVVGHFEARVEAERERYMRKFEALRTNAEYADVRHH
jgi:hypothetical protein